MRRELGRGGPARGGARGLPAVALLVLAALVALAVPTAAQAHGAPQNPASRGYACGPEGGPARTTAACQAALAAGGNLDAWDNIRVANVAGRDRAVIPDGKLCSGGIDRYRGLDLPRADWPATTFSAGAAFSFSYRTTIPHAGTFRMYLTNGTYDPTRPLKWSNVDTVPFLTAVDPAVVGSAYVLKGRLPAGRTGRQLILTIWQNSSTPDTYYSCSDVVFSAAAGKPAATPAANPSAVAAGSPESSAAAVALLPTAPSVAPVADTRQATASSLLPVVAVILAAIAVVAVLTVARRRRIR